MDNIHISSQIYTGRPQNDTDRLEKELRTYDFLDSLHISYERIDHEAADTVESCQDAEQQLGIRICKNLFLCNTQKTAFYLLLMPGNKKFKTSVFSKKMGCSRLSFADADHMAKFLNITPGSVSILGLMNDTGNHIQLAIDQDLLKDEFLGCHPCINTSSLKIRMSDILERFLPAIHHDYTIVELPYLES